VWREHLENTMTTTTDVRAIRNVWHSQPTVEGAGVHLRRAIGLGSQDVNLFDPFLLLDDFRSENPDDYRRGFPWHPHRGMETITYVLDGDVEHADSLGHRGRISAGDLQWMTAGSGILHQEMPQGDAKGRMAGFQLWANLPSSQKMTSPRYRDVTNADIPIVKIDGGATVRVISGEVGGARGPVHDIATHPEYLDVSLAPASSFEHRVPEGHTVFAYGFEGDAHVGGPEAPALGDGSLILFDAGTRVVIGTRSRPARLLLVSGAPLREPIAWRGPIVMNTEKELEAAFRELRGGTFIKSRDHVDARDRRS
jgi:redox-sensitive bicupin YhaK (pirin superfamily)